MSGMTSNKPYFVRALYEWILDNNCTPYVVTAVDYPGVEVPLEFAADGQVTLSMSPAAVRNFTMENDFVAFSARFSGVPRDLYIPIEAIMAIYAKENGQGMAFDVTLPTDDEPDSRPKPHAVPSTKPAEKKSHLKVVK